MAKLDFKLDFELLQKDLRQLIRLVASEVEFVPSIGIKCWQLRNLNLVYDKKLRVLMEQARLERLAHTRKVNLLVKLIFIAENMRYQNCINEITKVEDDLLEMERREMAEFIKADSIKAEETKSENQPSKPKPEEKVRSLLTFFKAQPKANHEAQLVARHPLFGKLETCITVSSRMKPQVQWQWRTLEELFSYLKQPRMAARSKRVVNIFNDESALVYFNYSVSDDPLTINARNPFQRVF